MPGSDPPRPPHIHVWREHTHPSRRQVKVETCIGCGEPNWRTLDKLFQQTVAAAIRVVVRKVTGLNQ